MTTSFLRYAIILGLLSAIGPFAIDMYLPALPSIGKDLAAENNVVSRDMRRGGNPAFALKLSERSSS